MKRLAVAIAAALILLSVSVTAYAAPEDQQSSGQSDEVSAQDSSKLTEEQSEKTDILQETAPKTTTAQDSSETDAQESTSSKIDIDKMQYATYNIKNVDMYIDIPKDMYVLTPGIAADDPALKAAGMTKKEAEDSLSENDTAIKAFAKDFSYDITVTMVKNSDTKEIGNLSTLDDKQVQKIMDTLLRNDYSTGCARNKYNNVLFLTLNMEYKAEDGTDVYGIQQYTIINDANIIITFRSKNQPLTNDQRALFNKIMSSVFFDVEEPVVSESSVSDLNEMTIQELDKRYLLIIAASIIAAAALVGIIVVAVKRKETVAGEQGYVPKSGKPDNDDKDEEEYDDDEEEIPLVKTTDTQIFRKVGSNELYSSSKPKTDNSQSKNGKLNSTAELSIPKNPYTPVGKAEAVAQPAMSVTSEIAKFSIINEQAKLAADKKKESVQEDTVVFAESTPKHKTNIQQIGESVFEKKEPEKPVSEYERRFGKNRTNTAPAVNEAPSRPEAPKSEPEKKELSQFEKRFGKVRPAGAYTTASTADNAEVKPVGELNIAPMITARNLRPENDPSLIKQENDHVKDPNIALLDEEMPQSEMKLKIVNPRVNIPRDEEKTVIPEKQDTEAEKPEAKTEDKEAEKVSSPEEEPEQKNQSLYSADSSDEIIVTDIQNEVESADENNSLDDFFSSEDGVSDSIELSDSAVVLTGLEPKVEAVPEPTAVTPTKNETVDETPSVRPEEESSEVTAEIPAVNETPVVTPEEEIQESAAELPVVDETPIVTASENDTAAAVNGPESDEEATESVSDAPVITPKEKTADEASAEVETNPENMSFAAQDKQTEAAAEKSDVTPEEEKTGSDTPAENDITVEAPVEATEEVKAELPQEDAVSGENETDIPQDNKADIPDDDASQVKHEEAEKDNNEDELISAPEESEEPTEHIEKDKKEDFLKPPSPAKKPQKKEQPKEEITVTEPTEKDSSETEKQSFFDKVKNKIFDAGETDSIYETAAIEPEKNKASTMSFIDKIRNKLKNHLPEESEEPQTETAEMEEFFSDVSENQKTSDVKAEPAEEPETGVKEIFRSPKMTNRVEIGIEKGKDGNIVINSFNGIGGKPEAVEIKDGSAELKAAEEKAKLDKAHEEAKDGSAEPQEPEETAKQEAKSAEEDKTPVKPEKTPTATEASQSEPKKKEGRRKKKKKKNKSNAAVNAVAAKGTESVVDAAAAIGTANAAGQAATAGAAVIGAGVVAAAAVKGAEITAKAVSESKADNVSNSADASKETKPEPMTVESVKDTIPEPDVMEAVTNVQSKYFTDEAVAESQPESVKAEQPEQPEPEAAEPVKAEQPEPEAAEPVKAEQPEPVEPEIDFKRESGIVFELPDTYFAQPIIPKKGMLTFIPALESVNAEEYNKKFEAILSGKVQSDPEPLIQYDSAPEPSAAESLQIEEPEPVPVVQPAVQPEIPEPAAEIPEQKASRPKKRKVRKQDAEIEFYSEEGEDDTLDPFAPGSGEIPLKDLEEKPADTIGSKLKRSLGKIFTTPDGED